MTKKSPILLILVIFSLGIRAQDNVKLFDFWKYYSDVDNSLYKEFCSTAFEYLDDRKSKIADLKTEKDWLKRQKEVKEKLNRLIGEFPEKTPLNVKITGVIEMGDYKVEKLIYESMPGYYVTAGLFLPKNIIGKAPAIIYVSGHSAVSFRSETYQHVIINLVKKGFVVLAIDPMGQGERKQYLDSSTNKPRFGPTSEHSYVGAQCYISGYSPTKYFVWDGIRAVDYLISRDDVDSERIGMTGRSGGGTQTAYISAFDERIKASAPECFITSLEYLLKSKGPQDAEQNLFHTISEGLDHADLIEVRAPKPTLLITTTRDMFSIQGARDTYMESKRAYKALGDENAMQMVEDDAGHKSTKKNREAMYAFFQKTLNNPGSSKDLDVEIFKEEELWATETGQVVNSLGGETIYTLNRKIIEDQVKSLEKRRKQQNSNKIIKVAKKATGFNYPENFGKSIFSGRYVNEEYEVEKYLVQGSGDYMLPIALFNPKNPVNKKVVIFLSDNGMVNAANENEEVMDLVNSGQTILLFDVAGIGSLGPGYLKGDSQFGNASFNLWFGGIMVGESVVGKRVEDITRITHWIKENINDSEGVIAIGKGAVSSEILHASIFNNTIDQVCLMNPFLSFADIALSKDYEPSFIMSSVAGAIKEYDLIDLMGSFAPNKLAIINPVRSDSEKMNIGEALIKLPYLIKNYKNEKDKNKLQILVDDNRELSEIIRN